MLCPARRMRRAGPTRPSSILDRDRLPAHAVIGHSAPRRLLGSITGLDQLRQSIERQAVTNVILRRAAYCAALLLSAAAPPETGRVAHVIDGDTVRLESNERIRIAGIDAPETRNGQAKCPAEATRGKVATQRAAAMLEGRSVTIVRVRRSYKRTVARLYLSSRDVARELVQIGVARWWPRGEAKPNWCAGTQR